MTNNHLPSQASHGVTLCDLCAASHASHPRKGGCDGCDGGVRAGSDVTLDLVPMPRFESRGGVAGRGIAFALCGSEAAPC